MRTHDEPDRNRRAGGNPRRAVRPAETPTRMDLRGQSPAALLALQRAIGNAAMARLVADQRDRESPVEDQPQPVQRSAVHDVLRSPGQPLDSATRTEMESRLGADFSDVRLHNGPAARNSAAEIGARAYTSGHHVVVGEGGADRHTLAHELTHVIQQRTGPVAGTDTGTGLSVSDPGDRFEREAEATATAALRGPVPGPPHAQRAVTAPEFAVQRLKVQGGAVVPLADQPDTFLLDLVRTIDADSGARTYTHDGVTYAVGSKDLDNAKKLLSERQQKLSKTYKSYDDYAEKQRSWQEKRANKPAAALTTGSYLYHGTSKEVALIVKDRGLSPAQPSFRGGKWDASRDGFLSMTKDRRTVTVKANSVILRMKVEDGDVDTWNWKDVGGNSEVVSTREVPQDRLEWSEDKTTWQTMNTLT